MTPRPTFKRSGRQDPDRPKNRPESTPGPAPIRFAGSFRWWMDELLPAWVKRHYSPQDSWKDKPFSQEDVKFFSRGLRELSELFTQERSKVRGSYFSHPKYRSAYLLYFLPLQAAKFLALYQRHPEPLSRALARTDGGTFKILDLGAGPATGSLATLMAIHELTKEGERARNADKLKLPAKIEVTLVDNERHILEDGRKLVEAFAESFPSLRGRIQVRAVCAPWWSVTVEDTDLTLLGHVINEGMAPDKGVRALGDLLDRARGAGVLFVEPASSQTSHGLSRLRDELLGHTSKKDEAPEEEIEDDPLLALKSVALGRVNLPSSSETDTDTVTDTDTAHRSPPTASHAIWGPCLHSGRCPLARGRDWCHFSLPAILPGHWFNKMSITLGSRREWLKFSYVWFASKDIAPKKVSPSLRLVLSDSLSQGRAEHLLCEPELPRRIVLPPSAKPHFRGDLITVAGGAEKRIGAGSLSESRPSQVGRDKKGPWKSRSSFKKPSRPRNP